MAIDAGTVVAALELDTGRFTSALRSAGADLARFADSSNDMGTRIDSLSSGLKTVGSSLSVGLTVPLVGAGAAMAKFAGDFEESSNKVSTIADTSVVSMDKLNKGVLEISNATGESATSLNEALYQTLSATNDTANSLGYLEIASKAAGGGFTSTEIAVDGFTSVMNAYGMKGTEAMQKVSDMMLQTQNAGKTTFGELSQSLYNIIPTAAALGVKFEDVSAAMATITSQGTPTSVATTQLRQLFVELSKAGGDASEAFEKVAGKSFKQFITEGGNVQEALKLMEQAAKKNGVELKDMFGSVEAGNAAMQLTGNGAKKFKESLEQMQNSAGATEEAFNKMDQGLNDGIEDMLNSLRNLAISFGQLLVPTINSVVEYIQNLINWLQGLDENQKKMIVTIGMVVASIGPALLIIGNLITTVKTLGSVIMFLATNPIGVTITAIGFLSVAFYDLYKHNEKFREFVDGLIEKFKKFITYLKNTDLKQIGKDIINGLINGISSKVEEVVEKAKEIASKITSSIKKALDINSPSRVTTMYGEYVAEGLSVGMENKKRNVSKSSKELTKIIVDELEKTKDITKESTQETAAIIANILNSTEGVTKKSTKTINKVIADALKDTKGFTKKETDEISKIVINSLDKTTSKVSKSTKDLAQIINEALSKVNNYVNTTTSIIEKRFELWALQNKKLEGSSEYLSKQLEVQKETHKGLNDEIEITQKAIQQLTPKYGENSIQVLELQNKLLDLQIAQQKVNLEMEDTKKAIESAAGAWKEYYTVIAQGVYQSSSGSYFNESTGKHYLKDGTIINDDGTIIWGSSGEKKDSNSGSSGGTNNNHLDRIYGEGIYKYVSGRTHTNDFSSLSSYEKDQASFDIEKFKTVLKDLEGISYQDGDETEWVSGERRTSILESSLNNILSVKESLLKLRLGLGDGHSSKWRIETLKKALQNINLYGKDLDLSLDSNKLRDMDYTQIVDLFTEKGLIRNNSIYEKSTNKDSSSLDDKKEQLELEKELEINNELETQEEINNLEEVNNKKKIESTNELYEALSQALKEKYSEEKDQLISQIENKIELEKSYFAEKVKMYEKDTQAVINNLNEQKIAELNLLDIRTQGQVSAIQRQIDALTSIDKAEEKSDREREYREKLQAKRDEYNATRSIEKRQEIQEEIESMELDHQRELEKEARQQQIESLKEQISNIQENAQQEKERIREKYDTEIELAKTNLENTKRLLEEEYKFKVDKLNKELNATKEHYDELMKEEKLQEKARKLMIEDHNNEVIELLETYNPKWLDKGRSFGEKLIEGLNSTKASIQAKVNEILSLVNQANSASIAEPTMTENSRVPSQRRGVTGYAEGTDNATKGWHWVGEEGPELLWFDGGERVTSTEDIMNAVNSTKLGNVMQNFNLNFNIDYEKLGQSLAKYIKPSTTIHQTLENHFSQAESTPSQSIKQQEKMLRDLAFQFR